MFPIALWIAVASQISGKPSDSLTIREIVVPSEVARRVTHFTTTLRDASLPGTVLQCRNVVELRDSEFPTGRIYGAICEVRFGKAEREYAICDAEDTDDEGGIGPAALGLSYDIDRSWIIDFARKNCL